MDYGRTLELLSYKGQSNLGFLRLEAVKAVVPAHNPVNVKADHKYDRFGTGGAGSPGSGLTSRATLCTDPPRVLFFSPKYAKIHPFVLPIT